MKPTSANFGWRLACGLSLSAAVGIGMWFYAYRMCTQMSMETWASYAGKLQARAWFQEGRYRILELSSAEQSQFTGRTNGPFEVWTWTHYTNTPSLTVQTADLTFIDAFNSRMRELWDSKQKGAEQNGGANSRPAGARGSP